jgi:CheY-like chemotaxis protein
VNIDAQASPIPSVLIVDDDPSIRDVLRLLFESEGFEVIEAAGGTDGVLLSMNRQFEFVVLDYLMPGMTGDKVAPMLRALLPETRIVAFSSALQEKPEWADTFFSKDRIAEVSPFLSTLLSVVEGA